MQHPPVRSMYRRVYFLFVIVGSQCIELVIIHFLELTLSPS